MFLESSKRIKKKGETIIIDYGEKDMKENKNKNGVNEAMEKINSFIKDILPEDFEINEQISETACNILNISFALNLESLPLFPIAMYNIAFDELVSALAKKRKNYSEYAVNVCGYFLIGYTNQYDEDNEKNGNFTPSIEYVNHTSSFEACSINDTANSIATVWCAQHMVESHELLMDVAARTIERVSRMFDVQLGGAEIVFPIFCCTHAAMEEIIKTKLNSYSTNYVSEGGNYQGNIYQINFAGCYRVSAVIPEDENGNPDYANPQIVYEPAVFHKTESKSDEIATSIHE